MLDTFFGIKSGMQQTFVNGARVAVSVVKTSPMIVTQIKEEAKDGYSAVQVGFGKRALRKINKPAKGHLSSVTTGKHAPRWLREIAAETGVAKVGDEIIASDVFSQGDVVNVTGVSKGKGFAGVVKRWGFAGAPASHGTKHVHRAPGSIGQGTTPGRVRKGKKMAGRMGQDRVTVKHLKIISVDDKAGEILVAGPVPGPKGSIIRLIKQGKNEN